jgi:RNA polymerase sigma-70 factor, ECF subfamily
MRARGPWLAALVLSSALLILFFVALGPKLESSVEIRSHPQECLRGLIQVYATDNGTPSRLSLKYQHVCIMVSRGDFKQAAKNSAELREALLAHLPRLRALAIALCRNVDSADDLVQDTILRALANIDRFQPGTCMTAWLFTILRNLLRSQYRKRMREAEYDEENHIPKSAPRQMDQLQIRELWRALQELPWEQQEALVLVAASNMSYADAARICGCAVGTVKSRVNRARARLANLLDLEDRDYGPDSITRAVLRSNGGVYL